MLICGDSLAMPAPHLVFVLPGLLEVSAAGRAPALARALAADAAPQRVPDGLAPMLAPLYGVERQRDWPFAAIRVASLGIDPGTDYWLAADPIQLVAGHDDLQLASVVGDLAAGDAHAFVAMLNAHFASDGLAFVAPRPGDWFIRTPVAQDLVTHPLDVAIGHTLHALLPSGNDAARWRRWLNEIQMLLHEHPINAARESTGRPPANSVWIWGGGRRPASGTAKVATYAEGGIAEALAAHIGAPARPRPPALATVMADAPQFDTALIAFEHGVDPATLEGDWSAPAWTALARERVASLTVIGSGSDGALAWKVPRPSLWQRLGIRARTPELANVLASARNTFHDER